MHLPLFSIEVIATCLVVFYYYPGVAPITKTHTKKLPHWRNDSPHSDQMSKVICLIVALKFQ